jgi:hypothetical protein
MCSVDFYELLRVQRKCDAHLLLVLFLAGFQPFVYAFVYAAVARSLGPLVQWKIMNFVMRAKYVLVDFSTTAGQGHPFNDLHSIQNIE